MGEDPALPPFMGGQLWFSPAPVPCAPLHMTQMLPGSLDQLQALNLAAGRCSLTIATGVSACRWPVPSSAVPLCHFCFSHRGFFAIPNMIPASRGSWVTAVCGTRLTGCWFSSGTSFHCSSLLGRIPRAQGGAEQS